MITKEDLENIKVGDVVTYIEKSNDIDSDLKVGDIFVYNYRTGGYCKLQRLKDWTQIREGYYFIPMNNFLKYFDRKTIARNESIDFILEQKIDKSI